MSDDWVEQRDKAVLNTVYYCETCNIIIELGDADVSVHKRDLPLHKLRRVMILRCSRCGNVVTDSHAQYSPREEPVLVQELHLGSWSFSVPFNLALSL